MRFGLALTGTASRAIRTVVLTFVCASALAACSLDFDALERGRGDAGGEMDARVPVPDAAPDDDAAAPDAEPVVDSGLVCPMPVECSDVACEGQPCDDGLSCTTGDVCTGGVCAGVEMVCETDGCSGAVCDESTGTCVTVAGVPDGTACPGGACCFGRCSNLAESGNCGGCGVGCEEENCTPSAPLQCVCVTSAGCSLGQACESGLCVCSADSQCAPGQTCVLATGVCTY